MTTGSVSFDSFVTLSGIAGPYWVGTKGERTWTGGDKNTPRSKDPSPQPPPVFTPSRLRDKGAFSKRYSSEDAQFHVDSRRGKADLQRRTKTDADPAPYKGLETVRWSDVIRHDNAAPKRATSEHHDYTLFWEERRQAEGYYRLLDGIWGDPPEPHYFSGFSGAESVIGLPSISLGYDSDAELLTLLSRLRGVLAGSDFNAGIALGESKRALDMIAENASRIFRAYTHARKGNLYDAARALGVSPKVRKGAIPKRAHIAARWLELQYGWLPLIKDVYGGAQFLAHHLNVPLQRRYCVRKSTRGVVETGSPVNAVFRTSGALTTGQLIAIISEKDVVQLAGLQDPASLLWELLPFSFVADWFIPIGSWLSARGMAASLKGEYIHTITQRVLAEGIVSIRPLELVVPEGYSYREVRVTRRVSQDLPVPMPQARPLNEVLSWKRAANAVALLVAHTSGLKLTSSVYTD